MKNGVLLFIYWVNKFIRGVVIDGLGISNIVRVV